MQCLGSWYNGGMAKVGAPTKYTKSMPEKALDIIGSQGKSITQFARDMRVTRETVYEWARVHKEFSDALQRAKQWSEAHWEDKMESMMYDREVNAPLAKLYLVNRFGWTDKTQVDNVSSDGSMSPKPLDVSGMTTSTLQEIAALREKECDNSD